MFSVLFCTIIQPNYGPDKNLVMMRGWVTLKDMNIFNPISCIYFFILNQIFHIIMKKYCYADIQLSTQRGI